MRNIVKELSEARIDAIIASNKLYYKGEKYRDLWKLVVCSTDILLEAIKLLNDRIPPWES